VTICSILGVPYSILDFNLQNFYENDAERISELAQIDRPRALPYCKILEMIDGFPVMGNGDLTPWRTNDNYSIKGTWMMRCWEHDIGWSKFLRQINKPGIAEWLKWTPGLVISYINTIWFNKLVNDEYYGKLGSNSTKILGYREAYPDLIDRKKQTGFEKIDHLINDFEKQENDYKMFNNCEYAAPFNNFSSRKIATEKAKVAAATSAYNNSIVAIAATKNLAVADMNAIMNKLITGLQIETNSIYTANYFSGTGTEGQVLFSLDGVHPNAKGYAVITNEIIKVINSHYNANLPLHNPSYFPGINIVSSN
jgi:hypothetical protein